MAGLGFVLGGLLQGAGQGIAQVGAAQAEERRQMALQKLKGEQDSASMEQQYSLQDRNAARQVSRTTAGTMAVDNNQAAITSQRDQRQHGYAISMAEAQASLTRNNNAASQKLAAELDVEQRAGTLDRVEVSATGTMVKFYKDGSIVDTGVAAAPKDVVGSRAAGGEPSVVERARGGAPASGKPTAPVGNGLMASPGFARPGTPQPATPGVQRYDANGNRIK